MKIIRRLSGQHQTKKVARQVKGKVKKIKAGKATITAKSW